MRKEQEVINTRFGEKIDVLMRTPNGVGPFPVAVFVSGLGMTLHEWNNSFDEIAGRLVANGVMTVQFTFPIFDAQGKCRELPLGRRGQIVEDVISWIRKLAHVDIKRVGILAQSYGVETVLGTDTDSLRTLLFISGAYFPLKSIARVYIEKGATINYSGDTSLPRSSGENTTVGKEFWADVTSFDDIGNAKKIRQPIFVIHGDKDTKIPASDARKVFSTIASKQKKLKIFHGGDHGIDSVPRPMREEFLTDIMQWFQKTL